MKLQHLNRTKFNNINHSKQIAGEVRSGKVASSSPRTCSLQKRPKIKKHAQRLFNFLRIV